jgi:hypothetical protein
MNDQHCRVGARASAWKHLPFQWGSIVRSRVDGVAETLALLVLLALAALALRYAREDAKEDNNRDRFFNSFWLDQRKAVSAEFRERLYQAKASARTAPGNLHRSGIEPETQ